MPSSRTQRKICPCVASKTGRVLDAQAGQAADREEASVVLVGVRAAAADQLVVLPVVDGLGRCSPGRGPVPGAIGKRCS